MYMSLSIYIYRKGLLHQYKDIKTFHDYTETAENEVDIPLSFKIHVLDLMTWFDSMAIMPCLWSLSVHFFSLSVWGSIFAASFSHILFFFRTVYWLFLFKERGREWDRERNLHMKVNIPGLLHAPHEAHNLGMCPLDLNRTCNLLAHRDNVQPPEPHQPG